MIHIGGTSQARQSRLTKQVKERRQTWWTKLAKQSRHIRQNSTQADETDQEEDTAGKLADQTGQTDPQTSRTRKL